MPRYTINLSGKLLEDLDSFAKRHRISRSDAAKRAFAILAIADKEVQKGNELAIVKIDKSSDKIKLVAKILGV